MYGLNVRPETCKLYKLYLILLTLILDSLCLSRPIFWENSIPHVSHLYFTPSCTDWVVILVVSLIHHHWGASWIWLDWNHLLAVIINNWKWIIKGLQLHYLEQWPKWKILSHQNMSVSPPTYLLEQIYSRATQIKPSNWCQMWWIYKMWDPFYHSI